MDLYASPMACSLAAHIAALEAGVPVTMRYLDLKTKRTDAGEDYRAISPNGYVPALRLPDGTVLDEGPAVLQWLADQRPQSGLAPPWSSVDRYRLIAALNFLSTEVHKKVFAPLVGANATDESRAATRGLLAPTLDRIAARLGDREVLVGEAFTVADAYLVTALHWAVHAGARLADWPGLAAYFQRHLQRPAVAQAVAEEKAEYRRRYVPAAQPA
jgi:glutathione S-transferase